MFNNLNKILHAKIEGMRKDLADNEQMTTGQGGNAVLIMD